MEIKTQNKSLQYIYEWCLRNKVEAKILYSSTHHSNFVNDLLFVGVKLFFFGSWYHGNNIASHFLALNKKATELFLGGNGHKVLSQEVFNFRGDKGIKNFFDAKGYASSLNYNVVLKPNDGTLGKDVMKVSSETEFMEKLTFFNINYGHVNISKFIEIKSEYRVYVYKHGAEIMYQKSLASIYGDGNKTFYELLVDNCVDDITDLIKNDDVGFSLENIVPKGKEIILGWKFRLDNNKITFSILDLNNLSIEIKKIKEDAEKVAKLMNLDLCAVDFYETKNEIFL